MLITCSHCKDEVDVNPYFYDIHIHKDSSINSFEIPNIDYYAQAKSRYICPTCGQEIYTTFRRLLTKREIKDLATKEK